MSGATVLERLGRFNARHPWSHNAAYTPVVLGHARAVRRRGGGAALDVGCGAGALVRRLGRVFDDVVGVEPDGVMAGVAARRSAGMPGVRVVRGTLDDVGDASFDLVTLVAVLHHLPLAETLDRVRGLLRPGGRLVVVGLTAGSRRDLPWDVVSMLLNPVVGVVRHPFGVRSVPVDMTAPTASPTESFAEIAEAARVALPGARIRRGPFWRSVLVWDAPRDVTGASAA